jgi:hypothetical protein
LVVALFAINRQSILYFIIPIHPSNISIIR